MTYLQILILFFYFILVTEDGYLGDCSSDGGNEKNFPMPAHLLKRLVKNSNKGKIQ